MSDFDTLAAMAAKLARGESRARDLCAHMLDRIARLNPAINAFSDVTAQTAMAEAAASDRRREENAVLGPLDGIPIAVKDLIDTTPAVCKAGLEHRATYRPQQDAPVVQRLRAAGAVILGVTETDPGAFSTDTPQVINPLDTHRSVGGSSGGSGASVAAGMAFGAIGTDTGGSVRIPAACCSTYGFKPTWGRISARGVMPLAHSLDHVGSLARCVEDLQILQSVLDPNLATEVEGSVNKKVSLGVAHDYFGDAEIEIARAMAQVLEVLDAGQIELRGVTLPEPDAVMKFHMVNLPKEAADFHLQAYPEHWSSYPDLARATVKKGQGVRPADYETAERLRAKAQAQVDQALEDVDAILVPVMPIDAPLRDAVTFDLDGNTVTKLEATIRYTALFNQTGHPVVSMPAVILDDGRSVNVQLVGRLHSDADLLALAQELQQVFSVQIDYPSIMETQALSAGSVRSN
ncbi:amidase [Cognatishimia sp. 1_MG-2023]|uniref:amidase n=1 Tax=Cognatishimia sp. 1_MG-2023 TaxID=3062642 RepID=UPI0026E39B05|nr:amidase [Cognatishimia sp. 1_MG-2023]MDO6728233.1 amidase [Cognatishimia sp. 1_MG-2023]